MQYIVASGLLAALLAVTPAVAGSQPDEDLRMGDDPAYFEPVEVPEAGIAVSFPADWAVQIEMTYDLMDPDDATTGYWSVLDADGPAMEWCSLTRYLEPRGLLGGLAADMAARYDDADAERSAQLDAVALAVGEAYRIDVQDRAAGAHFSIFLFDSDTSRYSLTCGAEERDAGDWMEIAETLAWLPADGIIEPPGGAVDDASGPPARSTSEATVVEVPEAALAMEFPSGWDVEVEMDRVEIPRDDPAAEPVVYWSVLYASAGEGSWCDVRRAEYQAGTLLENADDLAARFVDDAEGGASSSVEALALPAGDAFRVAIEETASGQLTILYLLDDGPDRLYLTCMSDDPSAEEWDALAATIRLLDDEAVPEAGPPGVTEGQRVEVPEAGIGLVLPLGWSVDITLATREYQLPPEFPEDSTVTVLDILSAYPDRGVAACSVALYQGMPMSAERHAEVTGERLAGSEPSMTPITTHVRLPFGDAVRVDYELTITGYPGSAYVFDLGEQRYVVDCWSETADDAHWAGIASTFAILDPRPVDQPDATETTSPVTAMERIDLPEAGLALSVPAGWETVSQTESLSMEVRLGDGSATEVDVDRVFEAYHDDAWCALYRYGDMPLGLDEHAAWFESLAAANDDDPAAVERGPLSLPVGDAIRVIEDYPSGVLDVVYLFDVEGVRHHLVCGSTEPPADDWLSVAESLEALPQETAEPVPLGVPDDAAYWSEIGPFETVVSVSETTVMRARCEQGLWIEFPDGSFEERIECRLSDDPVDPPDDQGVPPGEAVTLAGGACEWISDFWLQTDGSEIWAASWEVTIDPDGRVVGTSSYAPELLECEE